MTELGHSLETFVCPEKDSFSSGSRDKTLQCFVETLQFVFEAPAHTNMI